MRVPPPLVFAAAVAVGWFLPGFRLALWIGPALFAALLIAGGIWIGLWALVWFRRTGQDPVPWKPSPELIGAGPYRFSRNPMYLGMTMLTLGSGGLAARGWIVILALVALAVVHFTAVLPEERYLTGRFGHNYNDYIKRVRRYF